jgi:hypothetical protein
VQLACSYFIENRRFEIRRRLDFIEAANQPAQMLGFGYFPAASGALPGVPFHSEPSGKIQAVLQVIFKVLLKCTAVHNCLSIAGLNPESFFVVQNNRAGRVYL